MNATFLKSIKRNKWLALAALVGLTVFGIDLTLVAKGFETAPIPWALGSPTGLSILVTFPVVLFFSFLLMEDLTMPCTNSGGTADALALPILFVIVELSLFAVISWVVLIGSLVWRLAELLGLS